MSIVASDRKPALVEGLPHIVTSTTSQHLSGLDACASFVFRGSSGAFLARPVQSAHCRTALSHFEWAGSMTSSRC
ncbi:hypothetical protein CBOM_07630 [Ceraceosorus bombacis]|uniref:Uncharacterized protein n=1 Tax=Ceraceosorus bombacis TaxID=401625 RepID=A0A0P1BKP8_9BASI|nr:hypothetical protein CBOM_07630 [Ceraceosorus bombacis]